MNPQVIFGIGGAIAAVYGAIVAIWDDWALSLMGRSVTGRQFSPAYIRLIGIVLCVGEVSIVVLALTGVLPDH
ncbi:hypothetical protein [Frondihabitans sp. Leaf304]|uniref:hypothetical protein n=1 Tax=Frondihabitans sp. Leaf304 TaxID=1736329 RepID=UPI0006FDB31E|nr:hypothetical protein [Frondihabitans sp. Leaf304]KQQ28565.1 hypothetical protein ASF54_07865 [Frondihabitans sp. Leaf304]